MKTKIIVGYSGKGGVGKSTMSAFAALELAKQGKKVAILDADVATPSMHRIFEENQNIGNGSIRIFSFGFDGKVASMTKSLIKNFFSEALIEIKKEEFDVVIVDTPPSLTETHDVLVNVIPINAVFFVTQPTKLSLEDMLTTKDFFIGRGIPILGIIQNMIGKGLGSPIDSEKELSIKTIDKVKLTESNQDILSAKNKRLPNLVKLINKIEKSELNIEHLKVQNKKDFDDSITVEYIERKMNIDDRLPPHLLRFFNLETWDLIRDCASNRLHLSGELKDPFFEASASDFKKIFEHFGNNNTAMIKIIRPPAVAEPIITGEVGEATMTFDNKFNVPMFKYMCNNEVVTLHAYEIAIAPKEYINMIIKEGGLVNEYGRVIPRYEELFLIANILGSRTGQNERELNMKYWKVFNQEPDVVRIYLTKIVSFSDECSRDEDSVEEREKANELAQEIGNNYRNSRYDSDENKEKLIEFISYLKDRKLSDFRDYIVDEFIPEWESYEMKL